METIVFDGRKEAKKREAGVKAVIGGMSKAPRLGSVVFAEDAASLLYTKLKAHAAQRVGIEFDRVDVSLTDDLEELTGRIRRLSENGKYHGVMVQKPGKKGWTGNETSLDIWWKRLTNEIDPQKDVDCLTQVNLQKVAAGEWQVLPATVKAVLSIMEIALKLEPGRLAEASAPYPSVRPQELLHGLEVTVVGRSEIVGHPLAEILRQRGASVSLCGSRTQNLDEVVHQAEVVVSATGVTGLVPGKWIKKGAVVIDVGSPKGDVVFDEAVKQARFITPVPGGVGPCTVLSLLENLVQL